MYRRSNLKGHVGCSSMFNYLLQEVLYKLQSSASLGAGLGAQEDLTQPKRKGRLGWGTISLRVRHTKSKVSVVSVSWV